MKRALFVLAALLPILPASSARSQDLINWIGKYQMNKQIKTLWEGEGETLVSDELTGALEEFANTTYDQGNTKITIYDVWAINPQLSKAPGFEKLNPSKIQARVPLSSSWGLTFKTKVKVKQKVWFFWISDTFTLTVKAKKIWARASADLDSSDPEAPTIAQVYEPELNYKLTLSTNKWYLNLLYWLLKPFLDAKLEDAVDDALASVMPALDGFVGSPQSFGTGGGALPEVEDNFDFETPALKISDSIQSHHLPFKTLIAVRYEQPFLGTWEESWDLASGTIDGYEDWGDSAIWTGHALAAESLRYKVTGDPQAKEMILTMLQGITNLVNMRGIPGWLNRAVQPVAVSGPPTNDDYVADWNGEPHVMTDFISRDQYMGVFFGLSLAYDLVDDTEVKTICKQNIEDMIDYLLENNWAAYKPDGSVSTVWHMNFSHQLAWVRAARRVNPSKYASTYWKHAFLADLMWVSPWLMTFDPMGSYFKFNLEHGAFYTYLRLETIPLFWQRAYKAFRIMRKALAHHYQAHFNMVDVGVAPWQADALGAETRTLLRLFLKRTRRAVAFSAGEIETVIYTPPGLNGLLGEIDPGAPTEGWEVSKYPLLPHQRPSTDFLWQRESFRLSGGGTGHKQSPGIDYTLPYWMGRYYGVFGE